MNSKILVLLATLIILFPTVLATNHYSIEHSEEMLKSGRINWRDYGPDAFKDAIDQNKPIFLLLTAPSWCYWCHVYDSDDYLYHPDVYPILNEQYIPIYVDADQRQDLTRQFLEGGWPSTTVMAPNRERLFGFSGPRPVPNLVANFQQAAAYVNSTGFVNKQAYNYEKVDPVIPTQQELIGLINGYSSVIIQAHDAVEGGFGTGQKFPQSRSMDFSLELYELTGQQQWLDVVTKTLEGQYTKKENIESDYNLFDPIEGGFHRYGTTRQYTPPHYEKMLYDNAKLLKTYYHLQQLTPEDPIVKDVVNKTIIFIKKNWFDGGNGGFYGNSDVHGEEEYYGSVDRPTPGPRIEKTKYSDWNSEAIFTYLYLYETSQYQEFKSIAEQSLDFFQKEMIGDAGAYHYMNPDGTRGVSGAILDNSYLILAFITGYEILGKENYLETAQQLADYSLENLYDWNSGGFFERNSLDVELYAPGENINLAKPTEENGIMVYGLLKLYRQTQNPLYLNAAIKTFGNKLSQISTLDRGYYYAKSAQLILETDLITEYQLISLEIEAEEKKQQESFWINDLVQESDTSIRQEKFELSDEGLELLSGPLPLLLLVALLAGLISILSPCTLPILPAFVAYSLRSSEKNVKGMTISFFAGLAFLFTLLGMSATLVGQFLKSNLTIFSQIAGAVIILFGIYILMGKGIAGVQIKQNKPTTYLSSFLFGAALGISWTPCVGPILVSVLLLASTTSSAFQGGILLFTYAVGLAVPLLILATYMQKLDKKGRIWRIIRGKELEFIIAGKKISVHSTSLISGLIFIILGYLIFSGTLIIFNKYIAATSFQKGIYNLEDLILRLIK